MEFEVIYLDVISHLSAELPPYLTYHSVVHTKYVVKKAIYIAEKENLPQDQLYLLKIAALYHDIGFMFGPKNHEEKGCEIVWDELPRRGLSDEQIMQICEMIRATKIPQKPTSHAAEILADADLEYLSTSLFGEVSEYLFQELRFFSKELTREKWNEIQVNFIGNHKYHTKFCKRYKEFRKIRNLEALKVSIANS
ncbi:MAG: HD domain-containing protein [Spirosomataceae bacterium]